jgi:predicted transposase YbfD/YdcC
LCLTQTTVSQKSNEITALPHVIETLALFDLTGCVITIDAMGAQCELARLLIEKHALYILALKDYQAKLAEDVRWLFDDAFKHNYQNVPHDFFETQEQAHGRNEIRRCWVLSELSYLERHNWPGLERVVLIESERSANGVTSVERRFYLSALTDGAAVTLVIEEDRDFYCHNPVLPDFGILVVIHRWDCCLRCCHVNLPVSLEINSSCKPTLRFPNTSTVHWDCRVCSRFEPNTSVKWCLRSMLVSARSICWVQPPLKQVAWMMKDNGNQNVHTSSCLMPYNTKWPRKNGPRELRAA